MKRTMASYGYSTQHQKRRKAIVVALVSAMFAFLLSTQWVLPQQPTTIKERIQLGPESVTGGCSISITSGGGLTCVDRNMPFSAYVGCFEPAEIVVGRIMWSAPGGQPDAGIGGSFSTRWNTPGVYTVTVACESDCSDDVTVKVLKVEITEPNENPVTDNNFTFNTANPGVCNVVATGTSAVAAENPNLEWEITAIVGATLTSTPAPPKGPNIMFTHTTLPASNSQFGNKTLTLRHPGVPEECKDTQTVQIFFSRDAYNHTGTGSGTTRNWYYYWKEGGVVTDLAQFGYEDSPGWGAYYPDGSGTGSLYVRNEAPIQDIATHSVVNWYFQRQLTSGLDGIAQSTHIEDDVQVIEVGNGKPNAPAITAGDNGELDTTPGGDDAIVGKTITTGINGKCETTAAGDDFQLIANGQGEPNSVIVTAGPDNFLHTSPVGGDLLDLSGAQTVVLSVNFVGIDCCAETCTHELKHKEIDGMGGVDSDGDDVPDAVESASPYHLDPNKSDTYDMAATFDPDYASYGDNEFLCRVAEMIPGARNASKDWSDTNGKQWGQ